MARKNVVFVIVEGPSDDAALGVILNRLYDEEGASFNILDILSGWQAVDKETNAKTACFLIYVTWTMMDLQEMKETFADTDLLSLVIDEKAVDPPRSRKWWGRFDSEKSKARFILTLLKESETYGQEFKGYLEACISKADLDYTPGLTDAEKETLSGLNSKFGSRFEGERIRREEQRVRRENQQEKEKYESTAQKLLADGDMSTLQEIAQKKIDDKNYDQIYGMLKGYLSQDELLALINDDAASLPYWKPSNQRPENDPSFFESEYYVWLRETFGDQADECLRKQYPILYRQKDEYEKRREGFGRQIHKTISEIVEIMSN